MLENEQFCENRVFSLRSLMLLQASGEQTLRELLLNNNHSGIFVSGMNLTLSDDEKYYFCEMLSEVYNFVSQEG
ncbi:hypothetical protein ASL14_03700 [Paenibacillus sp. IHB B 3084]|nr:hypothetical protein ASL14_03700 [Paenibacillus sp. IHB B 3084]